MNIRKYLEAAVNENLKKVYPTSYGNSEHINNIRKASVDTCMKQYGRAGVNRRTLYRALELAVIDAKVNHDKR